MVNKLLRNIIKIPNDISIIYSKKNRQLTIIGPLTKKSLNLAVKIFLLIPQNTIKVSKIPQFQISNNKKKKLKSIQKTTISLIKQYIIETSTIFYKKLKIVGVGYRVFNVENYDNKLLLLKLGYSHFLYLKIPDKLKIFCLKMTKLFIYGSSYQSLTQTISWIRSYKKPEPYKGKGILYANEKIILKEGKKI